jgi:hypothetical protein
VPHPRRLRRPLARALLTLATLALGAAPARPLAAQELPRARTLPPASQIMRRDGIAPYSPSDPSLAHGFGSVVNGVSLDGVGQIITPDPDNPGFGFFCTAQRIGRRSLVTAAHCLTNETTGALLSTTRQTTAWFRGPGAAPGSTAWTPFAPSRVHVRSEWTGFDRSFLRYDIAVLHFDEILPSWMTTYDLYRGDPSGEQGTLAGFGLHGGGTGPIGADDRRRWATNRVEGFFEDPTSDLDLMLLADFDDGSLRWDSFCLFLGVCDRGLPTEGAISSGDSGGPLFVGGRLAGLASFSSAFCGNAACTIPYSADPSRPDAFGTFGGWTPMAYNAEWIAGVVPEPGTWVLLGTGLLVLGAVARRRV